MSYQVVITGLPRPGETLHNVIPKNWRTINGKFVLEHCMDSFEAEGVSLIPVLPYSEKTQADNNIENRRAEVQPFFHNSTTAGALCTALLPVDRLNLDLPLVVSSGDIRLEGGFDSMIREAIAQNIELAVFVVEEQNPDYAYVRTNVSGMVIEIAEKKRISDTASTGVYFFKDPADFLQAGEWVLRNNISHDGVFYVSAAVNLMISQARIVQALKISSKADFTRFKHSVQGE